MKAVAAQIVTALSSNLYTPLLRITAGATVIRERHILRYKVVEDGRLGKADLRLTIDNTSGAYTSLLSLLPNSPLVSEEGARVKAIEYFAIRHKWLVLTVTPTGLQNQSDTIEIRARNNWHKFSTQMHERQDWTDISIGQIVREMAGLVGIDVGLDAYPFWQHTIDFLEVLVFNLMQRQLSGLIGDYRSTQARAYGRFEPDGRWILKGIAEDDDSDVTIGAIGKPAAASSAIGYHQTASWVQVSRADTELFLAQFVPPLLEQFGLRRTYVNAEGLPDSVALQHRLDQEIIEQKELNRRGEVEVRPDLRLQLWDTVALTAVPGIDNGTKFRVYKIVVEYKQSRLTMKLGLRQVAGQGSRLNGQASIEPFYPPESTLPGGETYSWSEP